MGKKKTVVIDNQEDKEKDSKVENTPTESSDEEKKTSSKVRHGRGKNYESAKAKVDSQKTYPVKKAIELVKEMSYTKFDATLELHMVVKKDNLSIQVDLPNSAGVEKKVEIADENTIKKLKEGNIDFDILLATAEMMPKLVPFARILGPRGMMPNPKNGTLIKNKKEAENFGGNSITLKTEKKQPVVHTTVGKVSMDEKKIEENVEAVFDAIGKRVITKANLAATMTPSVKIDLEK